MEQLANAKRGGFVNHLGLPRKLYTHSRDEAPEEVVAAVESACFYDALQSIYGGGYVSDEACSSE